MITIVGLGNPGKEHQDTRHNAGRNVALGFAKKNNMSAFTYNKKVAALASEGKLKKTAITILLPETFMNKSGKTVGALRIQPKKLLLIHDDSDLELGRLKFSFGKSSAGHKGVESVMRALKTKDFWRLRVGIQKKKRVGAINLVLMKFTPQEKNVFTKVLKRALLAIETFATESPEKAMSVYNNS